MIRIVEGGLHTKDHVRMVGLTDSGFKKQLQNPVPVIEALLKERSCCMSKVQLFDLNDHIFFPQPRDA